MSDSVTGTAYPRAALIGNPSDGFGGRTISFVFSDYSAIVKMRSDDRIRLMPGMADHLEWDGLDEFRSSVTTMGYYGGLRLLKASLHVFLKHCRHTGIELSKGGFTMSYSTDIPQLLGLSGSSAIISACLRALGNWHGVELEPWRLADLAWHVETEELGIPAGLQDRVAQAYNHPVLMDFDENHFNANSYGKYEKLNQHLENIYIAFAPALAEGSELVHSDLQSRYVAGETEVLEAVEEWKALTLQFHRALNAGDTEEMNLCINANFDLRNRLCDLHPQQVELVLLARVSGASAKFCGSGGAIIGMYHDRAMLERLRSDLAQNDMNILLPNIVYSE